MFNKASSFNQDLSTMIFNSGVTKTNYDTDASAWVLSRPTFQ